MAAASGGLSDLRLSLSVRVQFLLAPLAMREGTDRLKQSSYGSGPSIGSSKLSLANLLKGSMYPTHQYSAGQ